MTVTGTSKFSRETNRARIKSANIPMSSEQTNFAKHSQDFADLYAIGERIGDRYEVFAIHHGGMGVVYGCFDHVTKLPRALKTVQKRFLLELDVLSLFEAEAHVWITLEKHPYIVRAYLAERFNAAPYVIAEYVRGPEGIAGDLTGWLGHPRLTLPTAVAMALQIAQGMQHAVRKVPNLVHRDLKPANLLVNGDGTVMVTDFGLVYSRHSSAGTPAYMSPEQWRDEKLDLRSDIYAYGCILYEMFTAHRLFPASTESEWAQAHLGRVPIGMTNIAPHLPREIDQFVFRCLEKNPLERPQNWDEIVSFIAVWYYRLTGKEVVFDFSSLEFDASELVSAGYSLLKLKRPKEALIASNRALSLDQNNSLAWINRGASLSDLGRYDDALKAYDKSLAINPNNALTWVNIGNVYLKLKCAKEALNVSERALSIDTNNAMAWHNLGVSLSDLGRNDDALKAYDESLSINQNNATIWGNIGKIYCELGRYIEAIEACNRALMIDQNNSMSWFNKGVALSNLGRDQDACEAYSRSLAIDPSFFYAWNNLSITFSRLKQFEQSVAACDRALALKQGDTGVLKTRDAALQGLRGSGFLSRIFR
jgi:eukaryotic-like serine/threonine-protein kinase